MRVVSKTHVGLVRENNEDSILIREPHLFAVADGMGGYAAGEIASRVTLKAFEAATHRLRHEQSLDNIEAVLVEAFQRANEHVKKMAISNEKYTDMGTTLTALFLVGDGTACCSHVGDTRLYLLRQGKLEQLTRDHTYVEDLLQKGEITPAEAATHPMRHMLMRAIGVDEELDVDCFRFKLEAGDRLMLCSDGLTDMLTDEEILDIFEVQDTETCANSLLERALRNGGGDNISLVLLDLAYDDIYFETKGGEQ